MNLAVEGKVNSRDILTVWLTPHIKTLRMGSLARNNFTFCPIKCFFFVLVLLALTGAALVQLDAMSVGLGIKDSQAATEASRTTTLLNV